MTRVALILNGKSAGDPRIRPAVHALRDKGHSVSVRVTWEGGDAARMAGEAVREARDGRVDTIVAGGGDGTVNEVLAAAHAADPPQGCSFGILPLGTANDFARSTSIPVDDLTAALDLVVSRPARRIDLGRLNGRIFVNVATGGFGTRVTVNTNPELKRHLGGFAYLLTGLTNLDQIAAVEASFKGEGFAWEGRFLALAIGNGRQAGGGIQLCPEAILDDGLLDVMILPEAPPERRFDVIAQLFREGVEGIKSLAVRARTPWLECSSDEELYVNLDGEPTQSARIRVDCVPGALALHLGSDALLSGADGPLTIPA